MRPGTKMCISRHMFIPTYMYVKQLPSFSTAQSMSLERGSRGLLDLISDYVMHEDATEYYNIIQSTSFNRNSVNWNFRK